MSYAGADPMAEISLRNESVKTMKALEWVSLNGTEAKK
jgi:hypothetical protein